MAFENRIDDRIFGSFRAAEASAEPVSRLAAGPFDLPRERAGDASPLSDVLITGLLVVYPALAAVVALIVGLSLTGPVV
jgi:hypothetical protein